MFKLAFLRYIFIVLGDYCDPPQPWTIQCRQQKCIIYIPRKSCFFALLAGVVIQFVLSTCYMVHSLKDYSASITDYGHPERFFFFENPKLLGFDRQIGPKMVWAFRVFLANISAPILCPCFPLFNHYFYKKLGLYVYPNLKNIFGIRI